MSDRRGLVGGQVLDFDDLRAISRLSPRATLATVERWARKIDLRYLYDARGGIFTTLDALHIAMGIHVPAEENEKYRTEDLI